MVQSSSDQAGSIADEPPVRVLAVRHKLQGFADAAKSASMVVKGMQLIGDIGKSPNKAVVLAFPNSNSVSKIRVVI